MAKPRICRRGDLVDEASFEQDGEHVQQVGTLAKRHVREASLDLIPTKCVLRACEDLEDRSLELGHGFFLSGGTGGGVGWRLSAGVVTACVGSLRLVSGSGSTSWSAFENSMSRECSIVDS